MIKFCLDANILITAWHREYPIDVFPEQWEMLAKNKTRMVIIKDIFDEIEPPSSDEKKDQELLKKNRPLRYWLENKSFSILSPSDEDKDKCLEFQIKYMTKKTGKGANPNDILLIAYAKKRNHIVATLEAEQKQKPEKLSNYKIPIICKEQEVKFVNFVDLLRKINES